MECLKASEGQSGTFHFVEVLDNSIYKLTCSSGHKTTTVFQQQRFEVLFQIGANAIFDGYYREAVSSFASSLERFHEFAIRVLLARSTSSENEVKPCWDNVAKKSERQLGAFIFLWAYCFAEPPELLSDIKVKLRGKDLEKFRNDVIHEGTIPTKEEAFKFGNAVIEIVRPQIQQLEERFPKEVSQVNSYHLRDIHKKVGTDKPVKTVATFATFNPISLNLTNVGKTHRVTLEEYHARTEEFREQLTQHQHRRSK